MAPWIYCTLSRQLGTFAPASFPGIPLPALALEIQPTCEACADALTHLAVPASCSARPHHLALHGTVGHFSLLPPPTR